VNTKPFLAATLATLLAVSLHSSARADITTGLVGSWDFNEGSGSTAADSTANANAGTLTGFADATFTSMWTTNAWLNTAILFNQNGENTDYVNVPDSTSLNSLDVNHTWTVAAWVKGSVAGGSQVNNAGIVCKGNLNREGYSLYMSGGKFTGNQRNAAGTGGQSVSANFTPAANVWYHAAVTFTTAGGSSKIQMVMYINGTNNANGPQNTYTTAYSTAGLPLTIGSRADAGGGMTLPFQGTIDGVRIYNRTLTASDIFQLYTNNPPPLSIATQPRSVNCYSNDAAVFSVTVNPAVLAPVIYQWRLNDVPISGATASSLALPSVTNGNVGTYTVVVTNYNGSLTSAPAVLTVRSLPAADTTSGRVAWWKLDDASGSASAADSSGNGNAGALMYFTDTAFTTVWGPGIIGGALSFNGDGSGSNVVAVPGIGTPAPSVLDFNASPVFSLSAWVKAATVQTNNAAIIAKGTGNGGEQYVLEVNAGNYRFFVRDTNGVSYVAQTAVPVNGVWQHLAAVLNATNGLMNLYVNGALAAYAAAPYSLLANNHEMSIGNRQAGAAGYGDAFSGALDDVRVYNRDLTSADVFALYSAAAVPLIAVQYPVTYTNLYTLYQGSSPTFNMASVTGLVPLRYQWYSNGVADPAGTNSTYQSHNLPLGGLTTYCVVTNSLGAATSYVWTATVVAAPTAPYPQSVLGLSPMAYWRLDEPDDTLNDGNPGAIAHDYFGGNDGIYTNTALGEGGYGQGLAGQYGYSPAADPETSAHLGYFATVDEGALQIAGVDFSSPAGTSRNFSVAVWVNGVSSQPANGSGIVAKGYGGGGEQFCLDALNTPKCFRFFVRDASGNTHGYTSTFPLDGLWHHVVGVCNETNGTVSLYIDGLLAGQGSITAGSGILSSSDPVSIGSRKGSATSGYNFGFSGNINDVVIYNYALNAGQVQSNYFAANIGPRITQQPPASAGASEGGTLTVSAAALGTPSLSYQWQDSGYGALSGQTNATLVISNVSASLDGHSFYLTVTNLYGTVDSSYVAITIASGPPQIVASNLPALVLVPLGKTYTFSVGVTNTLPFGYQWFSGASPLGGQTNPSCTVTGTAVGSYTIGVVITNLHGSASASSVMRVVPLPNDPYATNVLALSPVAYWPLQETNAPAPVTMETNYGTLGRLGNAYYAMNAVASPRMTFGQEGALVNSGDTNTAVAFTGPSATNYAFVPHSSPAMTLRAPLSYEVWLNSSSTAFCDIMGQGGNGVNTPAGGSGSWGGIRMSYGGSSTGGNLQIYAYNGGANTSVAFGTPANSITLGQWHHCAMTFDGTTAILYIDGQPQATNTASLSATVPDVCSPFTIGDGRWLGDGGSFGPTRSFNGTLDEVAVYTNALTPERVLEHYAAGTSMTSSNYVQAVLADSPLLYYRMDSPGYVAPNPSLSPTALNFGSVTGNGGVYQGGVTPGGVAGPSIAGLPSSVAAPINGIISCVDGGGDPAFNRTGAQPFSALVWFRGYPGDGRIQSLMTHGTNWGLYLAGTNGHVGWNLGSQSVQSTNILNDGNWHMVAGVYDGTTSYLYVDGTLNKSAAAAAPPSEPGADVFFGGNTDYTTVGVNQAFLGGALAQAAFFTNALTAAQVQHLFTVTTVVPTISIQGSGGQLSITYTGTLLSSPTANGSYTPVSGATSPYTVSPTDAQRFYRARVP
jgi:hypothetical protein